MPGGRPRKPTKLKVLEGNRGHRTLKPEPEPALGAPKMPAGMTSTAQTIWKAVVPELDRLGLLSIVDGTSLEGACRGAATAKAAERQIDKIQSLMGRGKAEAGDYTRLAMLNNIAKRGWQQWKAFATEFGLTPAARSRLSVEGKGGPARQSDPIEAAFSALPRKAAV